MNENIVTEQESGVISKIFGLGRRLRLRRGGSSQGQGQGRGRGGQGFGRGRGWRCGTVGVCVCPKCGHQEPHQRGNPCFQKKCSKCGTAMVRGE